MKSNWQKLRRWVLGLVILLLCYGRLSAGDEFLGYPVTSVTIPPSGAQIRGDDERDWICAVANGNPAVMTVIDAITGERLYEFPLPGVHQSFAAATADGDTVYIGSARNARLYKWNAALPEPVQVTVNRPFGQTHLNSVAVGSNGKIYAGTYPDALVIEYDPESGQVKNLGAAVEGASYSRVAEWNGVFYAATHAGNHLVKFDPANGKREFLSLPAGYDSSATFSLVIRVREYIFFRIEDDFNVYDPAADEWVGRIANATGHSNILEPLPGENKAYLAVNGRLAAYDLDSHELTNTAMGLGAARSIGWIQLDESGYPGWSVVTLSTRGGMRHYNPATGNNRGVQGDVAPTPITIRSMARGPDGNVYVGGYLSPMEMARYDPDVGVIEKLPGVSQIEAMVSSEDVLYLGRYPGASVMAYDPAAPWNAGNPADLFDFRAYDQDRPFGLAVADEILAVGTVPAAGKLGGVLAFYDLNQEDLTVFEDVVPNQSIVSLAYRDGLLYGGTTIWGGLGIDPVATSAKLFVWDVELAEMVWMEEILPGEQAINGLEFDADGFLWGVAGGTVFQFDPEELQLVESQALFSFQWSGAYWKSAGLEFDHDEGRFYGVAAGVLFRLNPETWEVAVLTDKRVGYFARDRYGDVYFSRGEELYKVNRPFSADTFTWIGEEAPNHQLWSNPSMWEPMGVPGPEHSIQVGVSGTGAAVPRLGLGADRVIEYMEIEVAGGRSFWIRSSVRNTSPITLTITRNLTHNGEGHSSILSDGTGNRSLGVEIWGDLDVKGHRHWFGQGTGGKVTGVRLRALTVGGSTTIASGSSLYVYSENARLGEVMNDGSLNVAVTNPGQTFSFGTHVASLSGSGVVRVSDYGATSSGFLKIDGETDAVFDGVIEDGAGIDVLELRKSGAGTQTLGGINTYTGDTIVEAGTLVLSPTGELRVRLEEGGLSNRIQGSGSINLAGRLRVDVTEVEETDSTWNLVDLSNLEATFNHGTFSVAFLDGPAFEYAGEGRYIAGDWTFDTGTGDLTYKVESRIFAVTEITHDGATFGLSFETEPGLDYIIESSDDLVVWDAIETISGSGGTVAFADDVLEFERRFYRVRMIAD